MLDLELYSTDLLGLKDRGIRSQFIVIEIKDIDVEKLQRAAGTYGKFIPTGVSVVDTLPKVVFDTVAPVAAKALKEKYGVDAKIQFGNAPVLRPKSEFLPGLAVGVIITTLISGLFWLIAKR